MPFHIITQKLAKHFLFHSNSYYQEILLKWNSNLSVPPRTSSTIASQIIWYNNHILVDKRFFYNSNHAGQLFDMVQSLESKNSPFYWIQLNNAILKACKENLDKGDKNFYDLTSGHHIIKKYQIYFLSKYNSKEFHSLLVSLK